VLNPLLFYNTNLLSLSLSLFIVPTILFYSEVIINLINVTRHVVVSNVHVAIIAEAFITVYGIIS